MNSFFYLFNRHTKTLILNLFFIFVATLTPLAQANVLGEMQTFAPSTDGLDFITVHSARSLNYQHFASSNYVNFAKDHLLVYDNLTTQNQSSFNSQLVEYDFGLTYGLTKTLQLSLMAPVLLDYSETGNKVQVDVTRGVHSFRPGAKWSFYEHQNTFLAGLFSVDFPQVVNSPYTGTQTRPIYNFELAATQRIGTSTHGLNVGYRKRQPSATPSDAHMFPLRDQFILSYGYSRPFFPNSRFVFEAFSSYPLDKDPYLQAQDASSLDLLFGVKHLLGKYLRLDWGGTVEPGVKTLSPSWRAFVGLVYYWQHGIGDSTENPNSEIDHNFQSAQTPERRFSVDPPDVTLQPGGSQKFKVVGNPLTPVRCRLMTGLGDFDEDTCTYTAQDEESGQASIEFKDAGKDIVIATVHVEPLPGNDFRVIPEADEIFVGATQDILAQGGNPPYIFRVSQGGGSVSSDGVYRAPSRPGVAVVDVIDRNDQVKQVTWTIIPMAKPDKVLQLVNLNFITGKDVLIESSHKALDQDLRELENEKIRLIIIEGHTDNVGSDESNLVLSEKRGRAIRKIMAKKLHLPLKSLKVIGYGESEPLTSNDTARGRQTNRRVVLKVYLKK